MFCCCGDQSLWGLNKNSESWDSCRCLTLPCTPSDASCWARSAVSKAPSFTAQVLPSVTALTGEDPAVPGACGSRLDRMQKITCTPESQTGTKEGNDHAAPSSVGFRAGRSIWKSGGETRHEASARPQSRTGTL